MLYGLFVLLACQLVGEALRHLSGWPVPGPVIGILLVMAYLALTQRFNHPSTQERSRSVERAGDGLLAYLGVMFVPAGVGISSKVGLLAGNGLGILLTLVLSTVVTLIATVATFRGVRLLRERRP